MQNLYHVFKLNFLSIKKAILKEIQLIKEMGFSKL